MAQVVQKISYEICGETTDTEAVSVVSPCYYDSAILSPFDNRGHAAHYQLRASSCDRPLG